MPCCGCNRNGRCKNCSCVKEGKKCDSCLPHQTGKCFNLNREESSSEQSLELQPTESVRTQSDQPPVSCTTVSDDKWPSPDPQTAAFRWGSLDGKVFSDLTAAAYDEVIHWKRNLFLVPSGSFGKNFVAELARLWQAFADCSTLEGIAMKASTILQVLLLQKPSKHSKSKDHVTHLKRRLDLWHRGDIQSLLREGRCIQEHLHRSPRPTDSELIAQTFKRLMMQGKTQSALRHLSRKTSGGVLTLEDLVPETTDSGEQQFRSTLSVLRDKHPTGKPPNEDSLLNNTTPQLVDPILFEHLNADTIRQAAMRIHGAAGPSGLDAHAWKRLCSSFGQASYSLCTAMAEVGRRICTTFVHPNSLSAFVACRLIPLDKCPGVRPIGVGEVPRRIIAKSVLRIIGWDIGKAADPLQLCSGQEGGCEAAVHAMRQIFRSPETEGILLVDATNAFNTINRQAALHNISILCPPLAPILINTYRAPVRMVITGSGEIESTEGTTQGDPLAMAMYALAITPLIQQLRTRNPEASQVWFADDATCAGTCTQLRAWWENLSLSGPTFGYHPNGSKTHLVVKEEHEERARQIFRDTDIQISIHGKRHLGAALGSRTFTEEYVRDKVQGWLQEISHLSEIAISQPHAAYAAFVHGLSSRWSYLSRTIPDIDDLLLPLEAAIQQTLIPALTGRATCSDLERELLALPARLGGMALANPATKAGEIFAASEEFTMPLVALIVSQESNQVIEAGQIMSIKQDIRHKNRQKQDKKAKEVYDHLSPHLQRAVDLAKEKGSSSWLTVTPLEEHGFYLNKGEFRDALCLRYGWTLNNPPQTCNCGTAFTVDHAMICPMGGFPIIRHNEIRDITASLLTEVCHNVATEPPLQPLTGETFHLRSANVADGARPDIRARGFWSKAQDAFFDIRVFHPNAPSNRSSSLATAYKKHEAAKKREYAQRIRDVEHGVFTPIVLSTVGSMGREATIFYKRLADLVAQKQQRPYALVMNWLRCRLSFAILRSAIMCIRGSRSSLHHPICEVDISLAASEGRISTNH